MTAQSFALADRRVLITGAGNGIGREAALLAASRGAVVLLVDRDKSAVSAVADLIVATGARAYSRTADIGDEVEITRAVSELADHAGGTIDSLLHVAGIMRGQRTQIVDLALETWNDVIRTNLTGAFLVTRAVIGYLDPERSPSLVLVASRSGITVPSGSLAYGASKGGIHGFALSLAEQLRDSNTRVHTLCPGDVDTPLMRRSLDEAIENGADPRGIQRLRDELGSPKDIASALVHLIDPAARGIWGTIIAK